MQRVRSVDILRGFALICMVLIHFVIYLGDEAATGTWLYFFFNDLLGDWGAAGFLMMLGISQVLSAAKTPDADERYLFKKALVRSLYLFVVGLVMLALAWGPEQLWQWDILTLMGAATLVLYFCRFLPSALILALCAAIALATPWLRSLVDPALHWGSFAPTPFISDIIPGLFVTPLHEFTIAWEPGHIAQGFLVAGTFPLFPWVIFPLVGFVLGRRIVARRIEHDLPWLVAGGVAAAGLGAAAAVAAMSIPDASPVTDYLAPFSFYPDSFTLMLAQLGIALVVFSGLYAWFDVHTANSGTTGLPTRLYNRTSRFALTFYVLHYQLIGWTLLAVYIVTGEYRIFDLLGAWQALAAGAVAVVLLELLLYYWEKRGGSYSLEWFLAVLTAQVVHAGPALPREQPR